MRDTDRRSSIDLADFLTAQTRVVEPRCPHGAGSVRTRSPEAPVMDDLGFESAGATGGGGGSGGTDVVLDPLVRVSRRKGLDPLAVKLAGLRSWLSSDLKVLDAAIDGLVVADSPDLAEATAGHLLQRTGKKIRPLCVLLAARVGGREFDAVVRDLAVSAELVHAATLLHDDVIDMGTERRGAPTARVVYGNSASVLGGDHLLVEALKLVGGTGLPTLLPSLLDVISEMVHAEAVQLDRREAFSPDRDRYFEVIRGKTAALFRWGLEAGAISAGLAGPAVTALSRIGVDFGVTFQLVDDVLDFAADPAETGKSPLRDVVEGKMTWPLIIGSERDPHLRGQLESVVADAAGGAEPDAALLDDVRERVIAVGGLDETRNLAARHARAALDELSHLPQGRARKAIRSVIEAAVARSA
jgi:octaprenyl-diphosphate synthase